MICSIVIRAHNEERHIGRLLDGIKRQQVASDTEIEIIVVDSGSNDSTVSIASQMGARVISISKEEFTFGRALNVGCQAAKGEILLFASAHVYPFYKDWIEKMLKHFSDAKVGLVYGRQIGNEITCFSEHEIFAKWFPEASNYNQLTPFCNNANCAIRKSLWERQAFDEKLTGLEDLDWANKILANGHKIVYEAEAVIVHVHEETPQKVKNRYQREAIALKGILPNVHFNKVDFIKLFTSNLLSDLFHALQQGVFFKECGGIVVFRWMQFLGTYVGHQYKGSVTGDLKDRFYYPNELKKRKRLKNNGREDKVIDYN
jgi:glycosyltransferase involved in cell wall biosynthesis